MLQSGRVECLDVGQNSGLSHAPSLFWVLDWYASGSSIGRCSGLDLGSFLGLDLGQSLDQIPVQIPVQVQVQICLGQNLGQYLVPCPGSYLGQGPGHKPSLVYFQVCIRVGSSLEYGYGQVQAQFWARSGLCSCLVLVQMRSECES